MRRTWDLLDFLPTPPPSPNFTHRTLDRIVPPRTAPIRSSGLGRLRPWVLGAGWLAAAILVGAIGFAGTSFLSMVFTRNPQTGSAIDKELVRDLRLIENRHLYEHVDSVDFLIELTHPDLFGDDDPDTVPLLAGSERAPMGCGTISASSTGYDPIRSNTNVCCAIGVLSRP